MQNAQPGHWMSYTYLNLQSYSCVVFYAKYLNVREFNEYSCSR